MADSGTLRAMGAPVELVQEALDQLLKAYPSIQAYPARKILLTLAWAVFNAGFERGKLELSSQAINPPGD